jgi:hypothetical protein
MPANGRRGFNSPFKGLTAQEQETTKFGSTSEFDLLISIDHNGPPTF